MLRLELAAITHVLQARRYIDELDVSDPTLVDQCVLFLPGTAALDLEHLRSGRPPQLATTGLSISEDYMIGRQMPLGVLAQLVGAMLDALEVHFVLYGDELDKPAATRAVHSADGNGIPVQLWGHDPSFGS